jgi:HAD superfamily hydrolase (TIGR01509 family)
MKIKGVIFDVGQTLSNQLDKERLVERNKKYYGYVYDEILARGLDRHFPSLSCTSRETFIEDLNTLNLRTRSEKNESTEVLKEYRMSEQTLDILLSIEEKSNNPVEKSSIESFSLKVLDEIYSGTSALDEGVYELWPDTKSTLEYLRSQGYILGLASNTAHPVKHEHMLARLGITPLIDYFAVSSYIGVRKPNPAMVENLLEKMKLRKEEVIVVGDLLDRDILMGNLAGTRTVWINAIPYSLEQNLKRIREGDVKYRPTAGIVCLSQLPETIQYLDQCQNFQGQVRVAYYFPSLRKKLETGRQKAFISNEKVTYLPVELRAPIENLGEFDVVVHKVTDLLLSNDPHSREALENLNEFQRRYPEVLVIDPVSSLEFTNFRSRLPMVWKEKVVKGVKIRCPRIFEKESPVFPCIVKTDTACQVDGSHDMIVVHDKGALEDAISSFQIQTIVQEWVPHVAMFKVYILGEFYQASPCKVICTEGNLRFNSTRIPEEFSVNSRVCLDEEVVLEVNRGLKEVTGLRLISYDLAVQESGDLVIVDLNYFPGYYTVEDYGKQMDEFIISSYLKSKIPKSLPN